MTPLPGHGAPVLLPGGVVHRVEGAPLRRGEWLAVREAGRTRIFRMRGSDVGSRDSESGESEPGVGARDSESGVGARESEPGVDAGAGGADALEPWGVIDEGRAGLELAGSEEVVAVLLPRAEATAVFRCAEGRCAELGVIEGADDARVAVVGEAVVVAYHREDDPQIRVARWGADGELSDGPAPAACTSDQGGFCGPAVIGARGGRVALGARDGSDLWVIESSDGLRWQPLSGLR